MAWKAPAARYLDKKFGGKLLLCNIFEIFILDFTLTFISLAVKTSRNIISEIFVLIFRLIKETKETDPTVHQTRLNSEDFFFWSFFIEFESKDVSGGQKHTQEFYRGSTCLRTILGNHLTDYSGYEYFGPICSENRKETTVSWQSLYCQSFMCRCDSWCSCDATKHCVLVEG